MSASADIFAKSVNDLLELNKCEYPYLSTKMGGPIIQMPADVIATQSTIWGTKPDVIIETRAAQGGPVSQMVLLLQMLGKKTVKSPAKILISANTLGAWPNG